MDTSDTVKSDRKSYGRLILPSLILSRGITIAPRAVMSLLLVDISFAFGSSVGLMAQLESVSSGLAVIFGFIMGALSIKYKPKKLLILGLFVMEVSAIGCSISPSYAIILASYSLSGLGISMIRPMTDTLVGEYYGREQRASAMGFIFSGMAMIGIISPPLIGYFSKFGSWRFAFLGFMLPIIIFSVLMALVVLPSEPRKYQANKQSMIEGYREVFSRKSAVACLIGTVMATVAWQAAGLYAISFQRQTFQISVEFASIVSVASSVSYMIGSLVNGKLVNYLGRKSVTVISILFLSFFTIAFVHSPNLWLSLVFQILTTLFAGLMFASSSSLAMEQVPRFRGTIMSLSSVAVNFGTTFGVALGGVLLIFSSYNGLALALGFIGIIAAAVYQLFTLDIVEDNVTEA